MLYFFFFFNDTATTEIYTLSLHDALPIYKSYVKPVADSVINVLPPAERYVGDVGWTYVKVITYLVEIMESMAMADTGAVDESLDRKSTRLNSSHPSRSRMPSSA